MANMGCALVVIAGFFVVFLFSAGENIDHAHFGRAGACAIMAIILSFFFVAVAQALPSEDDEPEEPEDEDEDDVDEQ